LVVLGFGKKPMKLQVVFIVHGIVLSTITHVSCFLNAEVYATVAIKYNN